MSNLLPFRRSTKTPSPRHPSPAWLMDIITPLLLDRLQDIKRHFQQILLIGGNAALRNALQNQPVDRLCYAASPEIGGAGDVIFDEEYLPFRDNSFDLILVADGLHWVNDLPGCLIQLRRCLKPDGVFLTAMLGGESLIEVRHTLIAVESQLCGGASQRVAPMVDAQSLSGLLQRAGFSLPVTDSDQLQLHYSSPLSMLAELRQCRSGQRLAHRATGILPRHFWAEFCHTYQQHYHQSDGVRLTLEFIFAIGWAPHESQPKPLRPGSATSKLADALATTEISLPRE